MMPPGSWEEERLRLARQRVKRHRRGEAAGFVGFLIGLGLLFAFAVIPFVLMLAAIRWLWLSA